MIRKIFVASVATTALAIASPTLAGPGRGGGEGHGGGANASTRGGMSDTNRGLDRATNANAGASLDVNMNNEASRINQVNPNATNPAVGVSQGPSHASTNGITHANSHSVLAAGAVASTALPGLATGLTVTNANNTNIGTISQIVTDNAGNIRLVIVTNTTTGQTFRLAPTTLTINGTTVTTTSTVGG